MSSRLWRAEVVAMSDREYAAIARNPHTGAEVRVRRKLNSTALPRCDACGPGHCPHSAAAHRAYRQTQVHPKGTTQ